MNRHGSKTTRDDYAANRRARAAQRSARADEQARREEAVTAALLRQRARARDANSECGDATAGVFARAQRLADAPYAGAVGRVVGLEHVRPTSDWSPRGKGREALFRSLADHLFARYPVPPMLWSVFFDPGAACLVPVVTQVAAGRSLFEAVRDPAFAVPLTRRMCHDLLANPWSGTLIQAIRRVQVAAAGGDARLYAMWSRTPQAQTLGTRDEETFWCTVLAWLASNPLLDPAQLGPLMDYVRNRRRLDPSFSMGGRSALAMIRGMDEWHRELAQEKVIHGTIFEPSGFEPAMFDLSERGRPGPARTEVWRVDEIRTAKELAAEGRRMGHCVYSYAWSIEKRQTSIWSMTLEDGQGTTGRWAMLTIEVRNEPRCIVQVRGRFNRAATSPEHKILLRWAGANGLTVSI